MKILVLNAGSSSVKYQLFNMANNEVLASGVIEQIGEKESMAKIKAASTGEVALLADKYINKIGSRELTASHFIKKIWTRSTMLW